MKRRLSIFIALSLTASLFFSCSSDVSDDENNTTTTEYTEQARTMIAVQGGVVNGGTKPCQEPSRPKDKANHGRHSKE